MEAIRPGSVAKYNLLKVSESTDVGASGGKISDIDMGLRAESDEKKHQNEGTEEVAKTFPDRDNDALSNHSNDIANLSSATIADDPYENIDKLYYDDIANEKRYPTSKAIAIYETPADQLETNIDKGDDSTDSVSAQFINKGPRNDINLASVLPPCPPRTLFSPVLPQGPQPQKSNVALSVLGTNPSDIKASNSVNKHEYKAVPSTSAHPPPPLTSQLSQESSVKSTQSPPDFQECSYQLQHFRSRATKLVSASSESQLSSSPSSRSPLPLHRHILSNQLSFPLPKRPVSIPKSPSFPSKLASISTSNLATAADQETVKVSSSQLQQIVQNMVQMQETVGKLLKKDTTSEQDCEESEAADDQTQQLTLEHLSQLTSSRKRNVYEGDRGFPATKTVEESCSPMSNVTTKPVPPVPKPKPHNLSRNKLETQVESAQSEFDNTI